MIGLRVLNVVLVVMLAAGLVATTRPERRVRVALYGAAAFVVGFVLARWLL